MDEHDDSYPATDEHVREVAAQLLRVSEAVEGSVLPTMNDPYGRSNLRALVGILRNLHAELVAGPPPVSAELRASLAHGDEHRVVDAARAVAVGHQRRCAPIDWTAISGGD